MIHPSYSELMEVINSEVEDGEAPIVQSRYSIVKATANRAKEIIDARTVVEKMKRLERETLNAATVKGKDENAKPKNALTKADEYKYKVGQPKVAKADSKKPLSIAVEEFYAGEVKILANEDAE